MRTNHGRERGLPISQLPFATARRRLSTHQHCQGRNPIGTARRQRGPQCALEQRKDIWGRDRCKKRKAPLKVIFFSHPKKEKHALSAILKEKGNHSFTSGYLRFHQQSFFCDSYRAIGRGQFCRSHLRSYNPKPDRRVHKLQRPLQGRLPEKLATDGARNLCSLLPFQWCLSSRGLALVYAREPSALVHVSTFAGPDIYT